MLREFLDQGFRLLVAQAINIGDIHVAAMPHDDFLERGNIGLLRYPLGAWLPCRCNRRSCLFNKKLWHGFILPLWLCWTNNVSCCVASLYFRLESTSIRMMRSTIVIFAS